MKKICWLLILCALLSVCLSGCSDNNTDLSQDEIHGAQVLLGHNLSTDSLQNLTSQALTPDRKDKFPAVKKVFLTQDGDYIVVSQPVAYNGPVTLVIVIDGASSTTVGIQIVKHNETDHYVRDMQNNWFTDRFQKKTVNQYLDVVHLEAQTDNEIIIITGATVTTQGIVNGVNAAMGVYQEFVLGKTAAPVELMVEGFEGPEEE